TIDVTTGKISNECLQAHESSINRVTRLMSMLATGDDDGVIKLWDPRQQASLRSYTHHQDFISDFLWLDDKKHLAATSGDGTLSVVDVRSSKTTPFAQSEDQEDELLSAVSIKNGAKIAVGTQTGIISIWNRSSGYGDCVDRVPGHPHSVDALAALTPDVIVTGSSDGLVRVVQLLPHKLLGLFFVDHGTFPIERLKIDRNRAWLGSASHDDVLKMTDVRDALVDSDEEDEEGENNSEKGSEVEEQEGGSLDADSSEDEGAEYVEEVKGDNQGSNEEKETEDPVAEVQAAQSSDESEPEQPKKQSKKRKKRQGMGGGSNKKEKLDAKFFSEL
ncbi:WD repeat-containing protein jip5, partial [Ceratobasidium sp. 395]